MKNEMKGEGRVERGELRGEKCYAVYLNDVSSYCNDEFHPIETMSFVLLELWVSSCWNNGFHLVGTMGFNSWDQMERR